MTNFYAVYRNASLLAGVKYISRSIVCGGYRFPCFGKFLCWQSFHLAIQLNDCTIEQLNKQYQRFKKPQVFNLLASYFYLSCCGLARFLKPNARGCGLCLELTKPHPSSFKNHVMFDTFLTQTSHHFIAVKNG